MVEQSASASGDSSKAISAATELCKRLPPKQVAKTLAGMANLVEDEDVRNELMDKITTTLGK